VWYRKGYRHSEGEEAPVAGRKAMAQGKKAQQQHGSDATDLWFNELLGKYIITSSNTHQGHF